METQIKIQNNLGIFYLSATDNGLTALNWDKNPNLKISKIGNKHLALASTELEAYALGKLKKFTCKFDFKAMKATEFQVKVWKTLTAITYGEVKSYQDIAISLGDKNLMRAVGGANGKNPIPIIIPCHRVIAKNGRLGGYSGGLDRKRTLLNIEGLTFKD